MAKRTVVHALLTYRDANGERWALRGQEVDLEGEELERAERIGAVIDGPLPTPGAREVVAATDAVESTGDETPSEDEDPDETASASRTAKSKG